MSKLEMEVGNYIILDSPYCIWYENDLFQVEDMEAEKSYIHQAPNCIGSKWLLKNYVKNQYFFKKERIDNGIT